MIPEEITQDLRLGMSLDDCLTKHNTNLRELFKQNTHPKGLIKPKKPRFNPAKYVQYRDDHYYIRKWLKGKIKLFGAYGTLEDAIKVRDELIRIGWKQKSVDKICNEVGVERIKGEYNTSVRYS